MPGRIHPSIRPSIVDPHTLTQDQFTVTNLPLPHMHAFGRGRKAEGLETIHLTPREHLNSCEPPGGVKLGICCCVVTHRKISKTFFAGCSILAQCSVCWTESWVRTENKTFLNEKSRVCGGSIATVQNGPALSKLFV